METALSAVWDVWKFRYSCQRKRPVGGGNWTDLGWTSIKSIFLQFTRLIRARLRVLTEQKRPSQDSVLNILRALFLSSSALIFFVNF